MIGVQVKNGRDNFTIVGYDGGAWVLQPEQFGPVVTATDADLIQNYKVKPDAIERPKTEAEVIHARDMAAIHTNADALAERGLKARVRPAAGPPEGSPEAYFAQVADETKS